MQEHYRNKLINKYIEKYNINNINLFITLQRYIDYNKLTDRLAEKTNVYSLFDSQGKLIKIEIE